MTYKHLKKVLNTYMLLCKIREASYQNIMNNEYMPRRLFILQTKLNPEIFVTIEKASVLK